MAVMVPRENWTDKRLDDLKEGMGKRFDQVDANFVRVDADIRELRGEVNALSRSFNTRFDAMSLSVNERFDAMHQTMVRGFIAMGAITATCFVGLAGLIVF